MDRVFRWTARTLLVASTLVPAVSNAAPPVETLLPSEAAPSYRGRKVVVDFTRRGPQVSSMSVLCQPGGRERRELHATSGVIVADGETVWQYLPDKRVVLKRPARGEGAEVLRPEQVRRALASYEVRQISADTVAGRRGRGLEFAPRQAGSRPRRLVWVDDETGLILRTEVYGTDNRLARLSAFEQLEYHPVLDAATFRMKVPPGVRVVDAGADPCLEPAAAEGLAGIPVALPAYLPVGFERQCIRARRNRDYGEIQVVFGDGLSLLSLFASTCFREPEAGAPAATAVSIGHATGRWHDLGLVSGISWRAPWAYMALLGELSREELHRVAGSVRGAGEPSAAPRGQ